MSQSLKRIADRIIICGVDELEHYLTTNKVSLVVSTCSSEECKINVEGSSQSAQSLIDQASLDGVEHHQSLLYQTYGDFFDQYTPHTMTEYEEQAYFYEQAKKTLDAIENAIAEFPNKKVIIHCVYGSDRSAMVAVAYFLRVQGQHANMNDALAMLHKKRPGAELDSVSRKFSPYFGENFDSYRKAIHEYRKLLSLRNKIPGGVTSRDFFMANGSNEEKFEQYQRRCDRFGMSLD